MEIFDKSKIKTFPLSERKNKSDLSIMLNPDEKREISYENLEIIKKIASEIKKARQNNKPVILAHGAHLIKNGLSIVLTKLIEKGFITHLATNGASAIHDWELSFQGKTEEDVRKNIKHGKFGTWTETGKYINQALINAAKNNQGYGESIGELISQDTLTFHLFKQYSVFASAFAHQIPYTVHPGFGYDIIYTHPLIDGASIGKTSEIDFLSFVQSVSNLEGGVYISIGSAIMSPMIFEKALSMARNVAEQKAEKIEDFMIVVNDIQEGDWDWHSGTEPSINSGKKPLKNSDNEPPKSNPDYYLRFCKTFSRMNARELYYIKEDNRNFLVNLYQELIRE